MVLPFTSYYTTIYFIWYYHLLHITLPLTYHTNFYFILHYHLLHITLPFTLYGTTYLLSFYFIWYYATKVPYLLHIVLPFYFIFYSTTRRPINVSLKSVTKYSYRTNTQTTKIVLLVILGLIFFLFIFSPNIINEFKFGHAIWTLR